MFGDNTADIITNEIFLPVAQHIEGWSISVEYLTHLVLICRYLHNTHIRRIPVVESSQLALLLQELLNILYLLFEILVCYPPQILQKLIEYGVTLRTVLIE